jgi:alpha-methylacyl-CoA racemase
MGPLAGVKVIEIAGIGPGPFCAMMLSDMGAEVLRVDRTEASGLGVKTDPSKDLLNRGRRSVALNLKDPAGVAAALKLVDRADALIEGFRPGVAERLGIGPEDCHARNPKLVYGRMTGWGQAGPLAHAAGHDINYIALSGALHAIGPEGGKPSVPLNLVGDFGGGGMYLAFGIVCALLEARQSGQGQVVDAAMTDGAASLMTMFYGMKAAGLWQDRRGGNLLDGAAPFYDVYETADGRHVAIGSIEPKFYAELLERSGLADAELPHQMDFSRWPETKQRIADAIKTRTRDDWCAEMEGSDVCFAPVLSLDEAPAHPHNAARQTFVAVDGVVQPAPAPRFSRTETAIQAPPAAPGQNTDEALSDWGFSAADIAALKDTGAARQAGPRP